MDEGADPDYARKRAQDLVDDLRDELEAIIVAQEADPPDDEHDVEGASIAFERARVKALLSLAESQLAAIEDGERLARTGHPRTCETCGKPIGEERAAAVPGTRSCVRCAAAGATQLGLATRQHHRTKG